jgi:two-component system, NarL family, response regulator LiaR
MYSDDVDRKTYQGAGMTIRILLVDDHAVVRSGLSKFLLVNKDLKLVGEASDGAEAVQMVSLHKPDIVLMDLMMPVMDGIAATREIHQKHPEIKIIALTSFHDQNLVQGAIQAGAIGYLQKNVSAKDLGVAIRSAMEGKMTLSAEAAQVLAHSVAQPQISGGQLTDRERDVLKAMVEGLNNKEIAETLVISLGTVKFHISNIFQKLAVNSRVEAVKIAIEQKIV